MMHIRHNVTPMRIARMRESHMTLTIIYIISQYVHLMFVKQVSNKV